MGFLASRRKDHRQAFMAWAPNSVTPVKAMCVVDSSWRLLTALLCLQPPAKQHSTGGWERINYEVQGEIRLQFNILFHINIVSL